MELHTLTLVARSFVLLYHDIEEVDDGIIRVYYSIRPLQTVSGPPPASVFHDSIYEDSAVICVNFHEGNDCCAVLKSGTKFYMYMYVSTDLVNSFHHPLRLLLRCYQTAGEAL